MANEASSTTAVVPPRRPTILNRTDPFQNLIVLNVNAQAPPKKRNVKSSSQGMSDSGASSLTLVSVSIRCFVNVCS